MIRVGVSGALFRNVMMKQVYLIRREKDPWKGLLCFPGGRVQAGESIQAAMLREVKEETGFSSTLISNYYLTQSFSPQVDFKILTGVLLAGARSQEYQKEIVQDWYDVEQVLRMQESELVRSVREVLLKIKQGKFDQVVIR